MSIGLFGQTWLPATDDATTPVISSSAIVAITPPSSMVSGQVCLLLVNVYGSGTYTPVISNAGGQTWTAHTEPTKPNPNAAIRLFSCVFNGTWSADPSVNMAGTTGTYPVCMWLGVFDGVDTNDIFDVDPTTVTFAVETAKTLSQITTGVDRATALHLWGEIDDNTATLSVTGASSQPFSAPDGDRGALHSYVGNTGGSDCGIMAFSRSLIKAGTCGQPLVTTGTADAGGGYYLTLKPAARAIYPVGMGAYHLTAGATSHVVAVPTVASGDLMLAFFARTSGTLPNSIPSGWSLVDSEVNGNDAYIVYKKVAGASEPTDYTWGASQSAKTLAFIAAFDGTAGTPEVEASETVTYAAQTSTLVVPSLTPAGNALSVIFGVGKLSAGMNLWHPKEYSKWNMSGDQNADFWAGLWSRFVSSGATGTKTFTPSSAADNAGGIHVLLKAPSAGGSKAYYYGMTNQL